MDLGAFVSNPGASPWITTSPAPKLIRHEVQKAKKQELLAQAQSLVPDQQKLIDSLTEKGLGPADQNRYGAMLQGTMGEYLSKYNENPYYAFSKEGKDQVKKLQSLVNDPRHTAMKKAYEITEEERKKAREAGTLGMYNVVNGKITSVNRKTGRLEDVSPQLLASGEYSPLTIGDLIDYKTTRVGFYDDDPQKISPFSTSMAKPAEVIDQVNKWFSNMGEHKREQFISDLNQISSTGDFLSTTSSSNTKQVQARLNTLLQSTGLPQTFRDVIMSQYYSEAISNGQVPTEEGAKKALIMSLSEYASGSLKSSIDYSASPLLGIAKTQQDMRKDALVETSPFKFSPEWTNIKLDTPGREGNFQVRIVPNTKMLDKGRDKISREGQNMGLMRNLTSLDVVNIVGNQNLRMYDFKTGKLVPVPDEFKPLLKEMVVDPTFLGDTYSKKLEDGTSILLGQQGEAVGDARPTLMMKIKLRDIQGRSQYEDEYRKLEEMGYEAKKVSQNEYDAYMQNVDMSADPISVWGMMWEGKNPTSEFLYDMPIFLEYTDKNQFNELYGQPVGYESRNQSVVDFPYVNAMQSENNPYSGNAFTRNAANQFLGFGSLQGK